MVWTLLLWIFIFMKPLLFRVTPKIPLPSVLVTSLLVTLNFDWGLAVVEPLGPVSFWKPMPLEPAFTVSPMPLITLLFTRAPKVPVPPKKTETPRPSACDIGSAIVPLFSIWKLLRPCSPLNETAMKLLPTLSTSFPLITIGVAAAPSVATVLLATLPLPPATLIPLPPMNFDEAVSKKRKSEMLLFWIVAVVMCEVAAAEPCA